MVKTVRVSSKGKPAASKVKKKKKAVVKGSGKSKAKPAVKKKTTTKKAVKKIAISKPVQDSLPSGKDGCHPTAVSLEKRGAMFRKAPSLKVMEKVQRMLSQRMMLINRERSSMSNDTPNTGSSSSNLQEIFKVLGSTGNVYTVVIDERPRCDCPDACKNTDQVCKHVIFVFLKVLKLSRSDTHWYQKALTRSELMEVFTNAKPDPTLTNAALQSAYLIASGQKLEAEVLAEIPASSSSSSSRRKVPRPDDGSCCPICYDDFIAGETKGLVFCETSCGNPVHEECMKQWTRSCQSNLATCVWCRSVLTNEKRNPASSHVEENGTNYINLATSEADQVRDYSVYSNSSLFSMFRQGTLSRSEFSFWSQR